LDDFNSTVASRFKLDGQHLGQWFKPDFVLCVFVDLAGLLRFLSHLLFSLIVLYLLAFRFLLLLYCHGKLLLVGVFDGLAVASELVDFQFLALVIVLEVLADVPVLVE
jgi:hypothetical protein